MVDECDEIVIKRNSCSTKEKKASRVSAKNIGFTFLIYAAEFVTEISQLELNRRNQFSPPVGFGIREGRRRRNLFQVGSLKRSKNSIVDGSAAATEVSQRSYAQVS